MMPKQMFCKNGHSLEDAYIKKGGRRDCQACRKNRQRTQTEQRRQQRMTAGPRASREAPPATPDVRSRQLAETITRTSSKKLKRLYRLGLIMQRARMYQAATAPADDDLPAQPA